MRALHETLSSLLLKPKSNIFGTIENLFLNNNTFRVTVTSKLTVDASKMNRLLKKLYMVPALACINGLRWFHRVFPGRTPSTALAFPH